MACAARLTNTLRPLLLGASKRGRVIHPLLSRPSTRWSRQKAKFAPTVPQFDYAGDQTLELPKLEEDESIFSAIGLDPGELGEAEKERYSIAAADHQTQMKLIIQKTIEKFGRYDFDTESEEVKLAILTVKIRNQTRHIQQFPKDKLLKRQLVENIQHRRKKLGQLQKFDIDRFNWICEELNLKHIPLPIYHEHIPRRSRIRKAAVTEMMQTKEAKLAELQATLAMQREEYYAKKDQIMEAIEADKDNILKQTEELKSLRVETGYPGNLGEVAFKLADIKPPNREKWWRKHPEVLKRKFGNKYRGPKTT